MACYPGWEKRRTSIKLGNLKSAPAECQAEKLTPFFFFAAVQSRHIGTEISPRASWIRKIFDWLKMERTVDDV